MEDSAIRQGLPAEDRVRFSCRSGREGCEALVAMLSSPKFDRRRLAPAAERQLLSETTDLRSSRTGLSVVRLVMSGPRKSSWPLRRNPTGERVRRHHEALAAAPSILPALALLIPFAGALWARIKAGRKRGADPP
jgi:hypothetical protein